MPSCWTASSLKKIFWFISQTVAILSSLAMKFSGKACCRPGKAQYFDYLKRFLTISWTHSEFSWNSQNKRHWWLEDKLKTLQKVNNFLKEKKFLLYIWTYYICGDISTILRIENIASAIRKAFLWLFSNFVYLF